MSQPLRMSRLMRGPAAYGPGYEPTPEHTPTYTLDRHVAQAREEMGEARWAELNAEWERGE